MKNKENMLTEIQVNTLKQIIVSTMKDSFIETGIPETIFEETFLPVAKRAVEQMISDTQKALLQGTVVDNILKEKKTKKVVKKKK